MARRFAVTLTVAPLLLAAVTHGQTDRYFDSAGVRIRYVDEGAGEPVVLIHGMTSTIEKAWVATASFKIS
jgi:hypothetical protein